ncbi:MAG: ATP-binding protein [Oceanococcaceae bacterium]
MRRIVGPMVLLILLSNLAVMALLMYQLDVQLFDSRDLLLEPRAPVTPEGEPLRGGINADQAGVIREKMLHHGYVGLIMAVFFSSVMAFAVAWRIAAPLVRMRDAVVENGLETRDADLPLEVEGEVGELAETFRQFLDELRSRQQQLEHEILQRQVALAHLEVKNTQLEFASRESEQFVYIASHDLQEPVRTVHSFVQLLRDEYGDRLDDNGRQMLDFLDKSTIRMSQLIKGLLDYSRLGNKGEKSAVNMQQLLDNICADLDTRIREKKAVIEYHNLPTVTGYETNLRALLQNLIGNALKFTAPERPPRIRIQGERQEQEWLFSVADNGIGIAEQHFEKIFMIFQRLHGRDGYEGSGIGLAHCKKIIELHGGKIWLESTLGEGTTFYFTLRDPEVLRA